MSQTHLRDDRARDHDERHPALTPLVIDVIPDQTRAELEAVIDESLAVERDPVRRGESHCFVGGRVSDGKTFGARNKLIASLREDSESAEPSSVTVGNIGSSKTFATKTELLPEFREDSESGSDAASDSGGSYYD
jgi:hypothetical protein